MKGNVDAEERRRTRMLISSPIPIDVSEVDTAQRVDASEPRRG